MSIEATALTVEHLYASYEKHAVLIDVSLTVARGEWVALLGPNGAGKTTTIKILMNILPPTSGHAEVLGINS